MTVGIKALVFSLLGVSALIILISMFRSGRFIRCAFLTAAQGVAAFFAVKLVGTACGTALAANGLTLGISAVCGAPGVVTLLLLDTVFR